MLINAMVSMNIVMSVRYHIISTGRFSNSKALSLYWSTLLEYIAGVHTYNLPELIRSISLKAYSLTMLANYVVGETQLNGSNYRVANRSLWETFVRLSVLNLVLGPMKAYHTGPSTPHSLITFHVFLGPWVAP